MDEGVFPIGADPHEGVFRSVSEAEVSLDEMLSLACRQGKQDIVELLLESGANVNHRNKAGNTPLLEACSQGHVSIARLLLDRSAEIDAPTETTFDSALTWACTLGNVEIVRLLLDRRANVEHRTKDGCTALMFAALAGHEKVAKLLLDHHAEINVESDSNKDSPLTFACWKGHQKVVELFLDRDADIEHRTKEGFSPLMFAALGGHTLVAELLLKHRAKVNNPSGSNNDIPLTSACWKGHHQVVHLLLQHDSDIEHRTKDGCTPLMLAAREGHLSVAQLLLDHGAKVNMPSGSENNIPLTLACWKGHRDVVNLLLKNVSNIEHQNKAGCTPLMLAAREGHQEATRLLLDSGAQINVPSGSNDDTPLTLACWKGHEEVVSLLIERNSNVNHQTKTGCTPLMEATREGHVGVAKLLLEAGADVETPDNYGQSPFFMACWKGHADVAALLLEYDANKDCRTKTGITPLFQACRENHVDVVKLLLDYGCNPSTPFPNSRECPLTLAAEKGYVELTQLLLSRSAQVEARTKKGCSPLYLACREGYKEIAVMLAKHGASTEAPDQRGTTPLLAAYKNGHLEVVEWLLAHVAHLPSDPECNKALLAPMPSDTDLAPQRSKCIELIMKAKKAREQAALKNAQILCEELDAEKEKKESKRIAAVKKREKRKKNKRKKEQQLSKELEHLPVEGREGPDGEEGVESGTPPQPPPSPENVTSGEVSASQHQPQKKRNPRAKKTMKLGSPEVTPPLRDEEGSDSGSEYHDALPEFSPTEPPDNHDQDPLHAAAPPHLPPRPSVSLSTHDPKLHPPGAHTDMSATRHGGQSSKRSPQPKAEVGTSSSSSKGSGSSRGSDTGSSVERNRNDHIRGNQGAGLEPSNERKKTKSSHKNVNKDVSNHWNNQKNRSREVGSNWAKTPSPTSTNAPVSTKGVSSSSNPTPSSTKQEAEDKTAQSHIRGRTSGKQTSNKGHRSNNAYLDRQQRDPSPSSSPVGSSVTTETSYSKPSRDSNWSKTIYSSSQTDKLHFSSGSQQKGRGYREEGEEYVCWSSEGSGSEEGDWNEGDMVDQLLWSSSTDDYKIRSRKLKAEAAAQQGPTPMASRPVATTAHPTPTTSTSTSSSSLSGSSGTVYVSSQSWQEVTRPTRTVQLTVSNSLVGRIIGRGGSRINNIQVSSGAHINVSRNIPKSTERLITIKGTQRSVSKAQELIDEALSMPDSSIEMTTAHSSAADKVAKVPIPPLPPSPSPVTAPPAPVPSRPIGAKRYSDVVPMHSDLKKRPLSKEPIRPTSTAGMTSAGDSYTAVVCAASARPTMSAWTNSSSTFASITAATPSPTLQASASNSPTLEDPLTSQPPSSPDSDTGGTVLTPAPGAKRATSLDQPTLSLDRSRTMATVAGVSSTDFPPLTVPHSRSQSDPVVAPLLPKQQETKQPPPPLEAPKKEGGAPHTSSSQPMTPPLTSVSNSWPLSSPPVTVATPTESHTSSSLTSSQVRSEKLPYVPAAKSAGDALRGEVSAEGHSPREATATTSAGIASLAVGTRPSRSVAVITPTQLQQQQPSLPEKFPPSTSQSNSTPDLTSISPPSSSSSSAPPPPAPPNPPSSSARGGNYGAIGPPTKDRRTSLPTAPHNRNPRKSSYAGFLSNLGDVRENDPLHSMSFAPTPNSGRSLSGWPPGERRGRSTSLTGQHPFPQNGPFPHENVSFKATPTPSTPSQVHAGQSDDPLPPPGTPDTPHGESHPMGDQDFSAPGGVYGAIGSSISGGTGSIGSRVVPSSIAIRPTYSTSPLSSPRLPHLPIKMHPSDIWISSPYGGSTGPRMHHVPQGIPSVPPFGPSPYPPPTHHQFPRMIPPGPPKPNSDLMQRGATMPHQQKLPMDMGMRPGESGMGNGNGVPPTYHKRWSVPSFPHGGPPVYPPVPPHQGQGISDAHHHHIPPQPQWGGGWPKQGAIGGGLGVKPQGGDVNGQYMGFGENRSFGNKVGGSALSLSDPWCSPHWPSPAGGGGAFPSPPPTHYNGMALPVSSTQPSQEDSSTGSGGGGKVKTGRSVSCVTEPSWSALSREVGEEAEGLSVGASDLVQLMKSLDIGSEHMQSLKARKLSLQQLHSMSEEEWRSLKLPVGPRVKLMNAISNIHRKGETNSQTVDSQSPSEPASFSADTTPTLAS